MDNNTVIVDYVAQTNELDTLNKKQLENQYMMTGRKFLFDFSYFENRDCIFFPRGGNKNACHHGLDITKHGFNCMQCRCSAYMDMECPGIKRGIGVILPNGVKDCSNCDYNHRYENRVEMSRYWVETKDR